MLRSSSLLTANFRTVYGHGSNGERMLEAATTTETLSDTASKQLDAAEPVLNKPLLFEFFQASAKAFWSQPEVARNVLFRHRQIHFSTS